MRSLHHCARRAASAAALCAALVAPAAAQEQPAEFPSWKLPGWSFTPGVSIGPVFDSNVAIASPDPNGKTASDTLFLVEPSGQLEFFSARTSFSSGYRGALRRYFELSDLDSTDHQAFFSLRHRASRRVTIFADDSFSQQPTTDMLELNGLPFARVGSRYNTAGAGVDARLTRTVDLSAHYETTWVDFLQSNTPFTGGFVNGARAALRQHLNPRASVGGEYGIRWADLNQGLRQFTYQDVGGLFEYQTGEQTRLEVAGGVSHLQDDLTSITHNSPYARLGLTHRTARALLGAEYRRSYAPSFYLGGSHQSQDARAYVDMPFNRNRVYVQESVAWRRTSPLVDTDASLDSIWLRSSLGYTVQRWVRVEGYHIFTTQDNRLAGGKISRHLAGAQLVLSQPMRIR